VPGIAGNLVLTFIVSFVSEAILIYYLKNNLAFNLCIQFNLKSAHKVISYLETTQNNYILYIEILYIY